MSHYLRSSIQVAQGLLDHMNSLLGSFEHQHRRSMQDLLALYGITSSSLQINQGVSVPTHTYIHTHMPAAVVESFQRCAIQHVAVLRV